MTNNFLPPDAKEPASKGSYLKFTEGTHKIRVMSSAVVGYEGWNDDGEKKAPIRYTVESAPPFGPDGKEPSYFWAFIVWNYDAERFQIAKITQKTIRTAIQSYVDNEAWGDPKGYDLVVTRKGSTLQDTEYSVVANPHTAIPSEVEEKYKSTKIDLDAWMKGEDPFEKSEEPTQQF